LAAVYTLAVTVRPASAIGSSCSVARWLMG
jgi:hypothetical protein